MKAKENVTIPRKEFNRLVRRERQLVYINFFLIHICASRNIDLVLMAEEICELLHISPEQLDDARKKGHIRCGVFDHRFIYHLSDLVLQAAWIDRNRANKKVP